MGNKFGKGKNKKEKELIYKRTSYDLQPVLEKLLPIYWIMGPTAAGKTTQAQLLSEFVTGGVIPIRDLIEKEGEQDNERGLFIRQYLAKETTVPDELVIDLIKEEMLRLVKTTPEIRALIIDDFPKNIEEAEIFSQEIYRPFVIIILNVRFPVIMDRLGLINSDITGATVQHQLPIYRNSVKSIRSMYDNKMERIDGNGSEEEVFKRLLEILQERFGMETQGAFPFVEVQMGKQALPSL